MAPRVEPTSPRQSLMVIGTPRPKLSTRTLAPKKRPTASNMKPCMHCIEAGVKGLALLEAPKHTPHNSTLASSRSTTVPSDHAPCTLSYNDVASQIQGLPKISKKSSRSLKARANQEYYKLGVLLFLLPVKEKFVELKAMISTKFSNSEVPIPETMSDCDLLLPVLESFVKQDDLRRQKELGRKKQPRWGTPERGRLEVLWKLRSMWQDVEGLGTCYGTAGVKKPTGFGEVDRLAEDLGKICKLRMKADTLADDLYDMSF
ncbi:hypothetical protein BJ508DRAFT_327841 [Ascobolus immersus RN42]|uniref:Uncharacterized protein n=1 Tax=Ascobolus immersus RN42 TaxID=1160509 RepID=A0A3N4I3M4_ASCIM|nr:hypothetical protein BJ508DRAFT_327841 [Ascobolus immersus RN42]